MEQQELEWPRKERLASPPYELEASEGRQLVELVAEAVVAVFRAAQEARDERENGVEQGD
jgi:hypothetical protein